MNPHWANTLKVARKCHKSLAWFAAFTLLLFTLSGLAHLLVVWTGPQPANFRPPATTLSGESVEVISSILRSHSNEKIIAARVVPSADGPLLQLSKSNSSPREYYPLESVELTRPLPNYDRIQALWLAQYYSGVEHAVESVQFITAFSDEYPAVNRLLPVYRIQYKTDNGLVIFVHTETSAFAALNNNWKKNVQHAFQWLHTWSWLDSLPWLRVAIMSLLLGSLVVALLGAAVLLFLRRKRKPRAAIRFHRGLGWVVILPLLGIVVSGSFHLIVQALASADSDMRLDDEVKIFVDTTAPHSMHLQHNLQGLQLNNLSVVPYGDDLLLRASLATQDKQSSTTTDTGHDHHSAAARNKRFDGIASERGAMYFGLDGSEKANINDELLARQRALKYLGLSKGEDIEITLQNHFGEGYDFRNKRLPVWHIKRIDVPGESLFIDPISGILVQHVKPLQAQEQALFSNFHKWNPLAGFIGRMGRDFLVALFLLLTLGTLALGVRLKLKP